MLDTLSPNEGASVPVVIYITSVQYIVLSLFYLLMFLYCNIQYSTYLLYVYTVRIYTDIYIYTECICIAYVPLHTIEYYWQMRTDIWYGNILLMVRRYLAIFCEKLKILYYVKVLFSLTNNKFIPSSALNELYSRHKVR